MVAPHSCWDFFRYMQLWVLENISYRQQTPEPLLYFRSGISLSLLPASFLAYSSVIWHLKRGDPVVAKQAIQEGGHGRRHWSWVRLCNASAFEASWVLFGEVPWRNGVQMKVSNMSLVGFCCCLSLPMLTIPRYGTHFFGFKSHAFAHGETEKSWTRWRRGCQCKIGHGPWN